MLQDRTIIAEPKLSDTELMGLAELFSMNLEVGKDGKIHMMKPAGNESSRANLEILRQLGNWWDAHQQGAVFDSDTLFTLPDGSKLGPDAAYIAPARLRDLPARALKGFAAVVPNFVIELLSESDSCSKARDKMLDWMSNGVELGWLIDPYLRKVHVFAPTGEETSTAARLDGTGTIAGFTLDLTKAWRLYE
jgi:Uma2 family endonuclease